MAMAIKQHKHQPKNHQQGFSLVELMIALVLGLIVGGMVMQVFIMNNRSVVFQRAAITVQDQGRVALDMMARYIRMTGYQESVLAGDSLTDSLSGEENGATDKITVQYQAGNNMTTTLYDCVGSGFNDSGDELSSTFELQTDGDLYTLYCYNGSSLNDASGASGAIASNIEQLDILYGVDTNDSDQAPNQYMTATAVSNSSYSMNDVVAVKVCLVIASDNNIISSEATFDDFCVSGTPAVTDKRIRRKVASTISLRNRVGGS